MFRRALITVVLLFTSSLFAQEVEILPPEVEELFDPGYPTRAEAQRLCGHVDLSMTIDTNGKATDIIVLASSDPIFEKAGA